MSVVHLIFVKAFSFGSNVTYPKKSRHVPHWKKLPKARSYFHAVFGLASCHCLSNFIILFAESQQNEIHLSLPPPTSLLSTSFGTPFNFCSLEGDVIEPAAQIWKQKKKKLKASKARVRIWCGFELKGLPICMYINSEYMPPKVYINIYIYMVCICRYWYLSLSLEIPRFQKQKGKLSGNPGWLKSITCTCHDFDPANHNLTQQNFGHEVAPMVALAS